MSENEQLTNQTTQLKEEEISKLLLDKETKALYLDNFPDNSKAVLKIMGEPRLFDKDDAENPEEKTVYFDVETKYKGERIPFSIKVSFGAYRRWLKKIKDNSIEYVDKYALFSKNLINKKKSHSISVPVNFKQDAADLIRELQNKKTEQVKEPVVEEPKQAFTTQNIIDYVVQYKVNIDKYNEQEGVNKIKPSINHCALSFLKAKHENEYRLLEESFGEVFVD